MRKLGLGIETFFVNRMNKNENEWLLNCVMQLSFWFRIMEEKDELF